MITVTNVSLNFGGQLLFKNVDLKFTENNCYGIIGANGAGKSTFLKILNGELEPTTGEVTISKDSRMSVLKQDHFAYDAYTVRDCVIAGNEKLYATMKEREAIYEKEDFSDEDGVRAAELEADFADMGGWEAESDAARLIMGLGLPEEILDRLMSECKESEKVKILLAQALFGNPGIILLDEPTNGLDIDAVRWLEDFLAEYYGTALVVSHDRHFLNNVCTSIVDIDYSGIKMYVGNYEFWYESSQLIQRLIKQQNKKNEEKIRELQTFISRFSANKSKSRQATSRRKLLDKLTIEELPASSRRYPYIAFDIDREAGKDLLFVEGLTKEKGGKVLFKDVSFILTHGDKVAFLGNELAITELFEILHEAHGETADSGSFKWGASITNSYFPHDNNEFFNDRGETIIDWMRLWSEDQTETYLRGFLGRMLFSGDSVFKKVNVLSGGERVRCMFARMMLFAANTITLDRPTDHLDLESITAVNNALSDFKGNVLFTSHDYELVNTVANRIIQIRPDGSILDFKGNYEDFLAATGQISLEK